MDSISNEQSPNEQSPNELLNNLNNNSYTNQTDSVDNMRISKSFNSHQNYKSFCLSLIMIIIFAFLFMFKFIHIVDSSVVIDLEYHPSASDESDICIDLTTPCTSSNSNNSDDIVLCLDHDMLDSVNNSAISDSKSKNIVDYIIQCKSLK